MRFYVVCYIERFSSYMTRIFSRQQSSFLDNFNTAETLKSQLFSEIIQPKNPHFLKVSILGEPNVGKSSLINSLMPISVFPTSHVIHTTQKKSTGVISEGNVQLAFLDTPGIVTVREARKLGVEKTVLSDPIASLFEADLLLVLFDIANRNRVMSLHRVIVKHLRAHDLPAILVVNKLDQIKYQEKVPKYTDSVIQSYHTISTSQMSKEERKKTPKPGKSPGRFDAVFYTSGLTGHGIDSLKSYLFSVAKPGTWQYPADAMNDMDILEMISDFIRAQLLSHYYAEVPHVVRQHNLVLKIREDESVFIRQQILCPYGGIISRMVVNEGRVLDSVRTRAARELAAVFGREVELEIQLKVDTRLRK